MRRLVSISLIVAIFGMASRTFADLIQWPVSAGGNGHWYEAVYADTPVSANGTIVVNGATLNNYSGGITWTAANAAATARGGWLVDILSAAENTFVYNLVEQTQHPRFWYPETGNAYATLGPWLGGFQPAGTLNPSANWQWTTGIPFTDANGSPLQYANWSSESGGQPSDNYQHAGGPLEDALQFYFSIVRPAATWNDYPSWSVTNGYIVEYPVPEPSTAILLSLGAVSLLVFRIFSESRSRPRLHGKSVIRGLMTGVAMLALNSVALAEGYVWHSFGSHEYALTLAQDTWLAHEAEAVALGGHLVAINSEAEDRWVADTFDHVYCAHLEGNSLAAQVQIGYYYNSQANDWEWISGEPVTYTNLYAGFPELGIHAYIHEASHGISPYTWNASPWYSEPGTVDQPLAFGVIERTVPEPGSIALLLAGAIGLLAYGQRMRSLTPVSCFIGIVALTAGSASAETLTWDVNANFTNALNPSGAWSYGWRNGGVFQLYATPNEFNTDGSPGWFGPLSNGVIPEGFPCIWRNTAPSHDGVLTGQLSLHPGTGGEMSVARWTAPADYSGDVTVQGKFWPGDSGSMIVGIFKNGNWASPLWTATDWGTFDLSVPIAAGDRIEFGVRAGDTGYGGGNTPLDATITANVPEPSIVALLGFGAIAFAAIAWRRGMTKS